MLATIGSVLASNHGGNDAIHTILWIIAVALVIWGVVTIINGANASGGRRSDLLIKGAILIVVGLLVGPGGVSIFS